MMQKTEFRPVSPYMLLLATICVGLTDPISISRAATQNGQEVASVQHLPTQVLTIKTRDGSAHRFDVEVAIRPEDQARGLMFRKVLEKNRGMLFVWPAPRDAAMWMRDTPASLDMIFIDAHSRIAAIAEDTVPYSEAQIFGHGPSIAVLELPAQTTAALGIRVGDTVNCDALQGRGP